MFSKVVSTPGTSCLVQNEFHYETAPDNNRDTDYLRVWSVVPHGRHATCGFVRRRPLITHWMEDLSQAEYAILTGGFAEGFLLPVGVLRRGSLIVEASAVEASITVCFYWLGLGDEP